LPIAWFVRGLYGAPVPPIEFVMPHPRNGRILIPFPASLAICLCLCILVVALSGCGNGQPAKVAKNPRVVVTKPVVATVMDYQDFTGRLEAVKTVDIRSRVSGYVTQVPFKEGDIVTQGDLLFQIDVRPYHADWNQAEANLKVAIADRDLQNRNAERAKNLLPAKAISYEEYETILAAKEKSVATVGAMEAARDRAKLYVDYTRVIAPVTGRVSRRYVDPGNLINADSTVLTTIVTQDPMYAYFDVDERTYLELLDSVAPGQSSWDEKRKPPVMMKLAKAGDFDIVGIVDFVDNRVVSTSGTVKMRGVVANTGGMLKAGLFVRIRLPIGAPYPALVVPDEAILSDQERKYVWVVNSKNEVEYRSVRLGQAIHDLRALRPAEKGMEGKDGLTLGDQIIVSGMQRVRKGMIVDPQIQAPPPPPDMPLVALWQKAEVAGQKSEVRDQKSDVGAQKSEGRASPAR
jgi:RND family efflux transporter MFP subunit